MSDDKKKSNVVEATLGESVDGQHEPSAGPLVRKDVPPGFDPSFGKQGSAHQAVQDPEAMGGNG